MSSKIEQIENRLKQIESELQELRNGKTPKSKSKQGAVPWYQQIFGSFNDDPEFDDMIRAGKAIRDGDRGVPAKPRRKSASKGRR